MEVARRVSFCLGLRPLIEISRASSTINILFDLRDEPLMQILPELLTQQPLEGDEK